MAESKVRDDNFFMVSGWMLNRLGLKGTALHVFAIVYGFSQDGEGSFTGSLQYLCDFTNASKPTVIKALKELVDKNFVVKYENEMNGVKFNKYRSNLLVVKNLYYPSKESLQGGCQVSLPGGSKESLPNNISLDNKSLISKEIVKEVIDLYHSICISYPKVKVVSDARKKTVTAMLEKYSMDSIGTVFENAESSSFLKGSDGGWKAHFDWLMKEANFVKVLEGNYADKPKRYGRKEIVPGWVQQTELGDAELEAIEKVLRDDTPNVGNSPELADRAEKLRQRLSEESV